MSPLPKWKGSHNTPLEFKGLFTFAIATRRRNGAIPRVSLIIPTEFLKWENCLLGMKIEVETMHFAHIQA